MRDLIQEHEKLSKKSNVLSLIGLALLFLDFLWIAYFTIFVEWTHYPSLVQAALIAIIALIAGWWLIFMSKVLKSQADETFINSYYERYGD